MPFPQVSGIELIYKLVQGERWQHVPVIVMSSECRQEVVLEAFEAGASDFLIKPIRRNELTTLWQHAWRASRSCQNSRSTDHPSNCSSQFGSAFASLARFPRTGNHLPANHRHCCHRSSVARIREWELDDLHTHV